MGTQADSNANDRIAGLLKNKEKVVFCVGCKSIGQYGGFETFVKGLVERDSNGKNQYFVSCKARGEGCMEVDKLSGAEMISDREFLYCNAICYLVPVNTGIGSAQAIQYDLDSLKFVIGYIEKYKIQSPVVYIMACRIGPFFRKYVKRIHALGGRVIINPDGHEWKRSKWAPPIRAYWKISEKKMVKNADLVACDSLNIENYIRKQYESFHPNTTYVAYGVDEKYSEMADDDPVYRDWIQKNDLSGKAYYLIVGRFVPENNFETIIREFMKSKTEKSLVIITTPNSKFYTKLDKEYAFTSDPRICFAGTVYNQKLLKKIREKAYGYLHGHEVGGTNPSLLESLCSTKLNLLYKVGFNEEVARDAALYWTKEEGNLSALIEKTDAMSGEEIRLLGEKAIQRIDEAYRWNYIIERLNAIWNGLEHSGGRE